MQKKQIPYIIAVLIICCKTDIKATGLLPMQKALPYYPCADYSANRITYPGDSSRMERFYRKLDTLALFGKGNINIVHIGGSHIQADVMTNQMRTHFTQCLPGFAAERGFIFPFKAARTNNPTNYTITYTGTWRRCQNSLPPIDKTLGISGMSISTEDTHASVSFALNPKGQSTNWKYRYFCLQASVKDTSYTPVLIVDRDTIAPNKISNHLTHTADTTAMPSVTTYYDYTLPYHTDHGTVMLYPTKMLATLHQSTSLTDTIPTGILSATEPDTDVPKQADSLNIGLESDNRTATYETDNLPDNSNELFTINGFIPKNELNGITYHSLGVNGASLPSWLRCTDFGTQMKMLQPDLVILAIGVNDANVPYGRFDTTEYKKNYNLLLDIIYNANPDCAVIFVTNNDCVLRTGKHSHGANRNTALVVQAMTTLAEHHGAGIWNLYKIMGGLGSIAVWRDMGLANRDRVHFLVPGYQLLGDMMYNAIIYDWLYK
ncbi:MAG: GDSL-type esterase/lipase family protein [Candidatus Aphodosoma sp.]